MRPVATTADHLEAIEKWRGRLTAYTAKSIHAIAERESHTADGSVSPDARKAWAGLAREAEALIGVGGGRDA